MTSAFLFYDKDQIQQAEYFILSAYLYCGYEAILIQNSKSPDK